MSYEPKKQAWFGEDGEIQVKIFGQGTVYGMELHEAAELRDQLTAALEAATFRDDPFTQWWRGCAFYSEERHMRFVGPAMFCYEAAARAVWNAATKAAKGNP